MHRDSPAPDASVWVRGGRAASSVKFPQQELMRNKGSLYFYSQLNIYDSFILKKGMNKTGSLTLDDVNKQTFKSFPERPDLKTQ